MTDSPIVLALPFVFLLGTFWLYLYCYGLYQLGRAVANRYRTKPVQAFVVIALGSALLSFLCFFLPLDIIWKSALIFAVWITHTQAVGAGFWGGMELGKKSDDEVFAERAESWLSEWEEPVPKWLKDDPE